MGRVIALATAVAVAAGFGLAPGAASLSPTAEDPAFSVPVDQLDAAVDCVGAVDDDGRFVDQREPVVFVHGTFTEGHEQYAWNYELRMQAEERPYCVVTYPNRGQGDMQVSAEYVARAVQLASERSATGMVDLVGHSQGGSMPRWAIKYWPNTVQGVLDDAVLHAAPAHGTTVSGGPSALTAIFGGQPAAYYQFSPDSNFVRYVNNGDETPGDVDYTSIWTATDELVQPSYGPNPTAVIDGAWNIRVQDHCPLRLVEHLTLGTTDQWVMDLTLAILDDDPDGATDGAHAFDMTPWQGPACNVPTQYLSPATLAGFANTGGGPGPADFGGAFQPVPEEPAIAAYAVAVDGEL